jgi:uncharacterized protein (DUF2141 family)
MATHTRLLLAALALALLCITGHLRAQPIEVQVELTGLRNAQGRVLVAAHGTRDSFPSQWDKAAAKLDVPAGGPTLTLTLKLPAPGRYALMVLHDEDGDGQMSKNFVGLPREGFITGNNPKSLEFPRFDRSLVELKDAGRVELRLLYP